MLQVPYRTINQPQLNNTICLEQELEMELLKVFLNLCFMGALQSTIQCKHRKTMENGARVIKGFILSVPESVSRLWHGAGQLESQQLPPPTRNQEEDLVDNSHDEQEKEWQKTPTRFLAFTLYSSCNSLFLPLCFTFYQPQQVYEESKVLGKVAVFLAATVFFITISIPFPPGVKWATWIIYTISLFVIAICNFCY
ncbi:hypothetical protein NC652_037491 [Populus alba x Populus x berolinensis]|nr:hypothetical protein NC652_037491 [Populus alba x Populus x berolinensis]